MAFTFKLEHEDGGTPADPPVLQTAVPNWSAGDTIPLDTIPLSAERTLRVVEIRTDPDGEPVLVVEAA